MSANDYYGDNKQQYARPSAPPPQSAQYDRGYAPAPVQQQPQYYQQQPQPQYYQQPPQQQQPIYVQQQPASRNNEDCMTGLLAGLCICCTLDMLL